MKYSIYMTNFGYELDGQFDTVELAIDAGKKTGFCFQIYLGDEYVGHYDTIGGWNVM